jgi:hypothetical protein
MKVIWQVDDGYVGKERLHTTYIPDDELEGLDEFEKDAVIEEYVSEDFSSTVMFEIIDVRED